MFFTVRFSLSARLGIWGRGGVADSVPLVSPFRGSVGRAGNLQQVPRVDPGNYDPNGDPADGLNPVCAALTLSRGRAIVPGGLVLGSTVAVAFRTQCWRLALPWKSAHGEEYRGSVITVGWPEGSTRILRRLSLS